MSRKENKWEQAAEALAARVGVTVEKVRGSMTGVAYTDSEDLAIEAPIPRGPISFAIFAHEVGHQALHRDNGNTPRWVEEVEAWEFALREAEPLATIEQFERIQAKAARGIRYSFSKAIRRGVKRETIAERFPQWKVP